MTYVYVMHFQMASGKRWKGQPHQWLSGTLKALLTFKDLPAYQEWSFDLIGDDWKKKIKELTCDLVMSLRT